MITILDTMLKDSGVDYATAVALMAPGPDELIVHVKTLSGQPAHRSSLDDVHQLPDGTAFTSRGITEAAPAVDPADKVFHGEASVLHGGHDVRQSSEWKNGCLNTLPTIKPTSDDEPAALPIGSRRSSLTPSHDGLNRQLDVPPPAILNPPVSDEYRRRQQINDNAPVFTPRSEPPPGHTTAAMLEALALPGESAADAVARRQREAQAQVELGPVVLEPRYGGGYTSHRLD